MVALIKYLKLTCDKKWYYTLLICLILYVSFRIFRSQLPLGIFKDSFPSLLMPIVMFSIVELFEDIKFHSKYVKFFIYLGVIIISSIWLELVVPLFYNKSYGDIFDVIALFLGTFIFFILDFVSIKNNFRIF